MNSTLTKSETAALDYVRWLSTICIVVCHFQQGLGSKWAWVFNIGVQVFFFLSGFLYGVKGVADVKKFYRGRIVKLLIPYWILLTAVCIALLIVAPEYLSLKKVFVQYTLLQFRSGAMMGVIHAWFLSALFVGYLLLPIVDYSFNRSVKLGAVVTVLLCVALVFGRLGGSLAWLPLFYIGYIAGRFPIMRKIILAISIVGLILCFAFLPVQFEMPFFTPQNLLTRSLGGIVICLGLLALLSQITDLQRIKLGGGLRGLSHSWRIVPS
jgi:peptidoglycan/LPS O-acetylase OafA/YrhL